MGVCYKHCLEGLSWKRQENIAPGSEAAQDGLAMAFSAEAEPRATNHSPVHLLLPGPILVPSYSDSFLPTLSLQSQQLQPRVPSDIYFHTQTPSSSHMKELACFISFLWAYNTYEATLHFILLWIDPWKYWSISFSLLSPRFLCDIVCSCGCWGTHMSTVVKVTAWLLPRHEHCLYVFKMTQARHAPKCQRSFVIEVNWRVYPFIFSS